MFRLPFGWLPGHWGTAGKTREIMKAEYELTGYDLAHRLLEIGKDDYTEDQFKRVVLDLKVRHKKITESEYLRSCANLIEDPKQKSLALLELDHREGKISQIEYEKQTATLNGEAWVTVLGFDMAKKSSLEGSLELDWNDYFVEKLKSEGYQGVTSETIVNQWFMELCRNVALEEFDGLGDFTPDSEANLDAVKRWSQEPLSNGRKGYR